MIGMSFPLLLGVWFDYNTRIVLLGTSMLGAACGVIGVYLLLRKRALVGDAISHATLPGICGAYLLGLGLGWKDKSLLWLLLGAAVSGTIGAISIVFLRQWTRLKEDAALGIVLTFFFGVGTVLLRWSQTVAPGNVAGLEGFILGKTALMIWEDAMLIGICALVVLIVAILLHKEFRLLCFDSGYARSQGWPVTSLDLILMACVVTVVIVGLQAVGAILVISLLVVPPASARFWTHRLRGMLIISALLGTVSCLLGALASAYLSKLPSGASIVLVSIFFFCASFLFGTAQGVWWRWRRLASRSVDADRQHVLRGLFELMEARGIAPSLQQDRTQLIDYSELSLLRHWRTNRLRSTLEQLRRSGDLKIENEMASFTEQGLQRAIDAVRRHRLYELYLQKQVDLPDTAIDRSADFGEHDIDDEILTMLEQQLGPNSTLLPKSLHPILNPVRDGVRP